MDPRALDHRGFGGLFPTDWKMSTPCENSEPFSYFSYPIKPISKPVVKPHPLFDETWTRLPIDCINTYSNQHFLGWANTCILIVCEHPDGSPVRPNPELARHWCPPGCYTC